MTSLLHRRVASVMAFAETGLRSLQSERLDTRFVPDPDRPHQIASNGAIRSSGKKFRRCRFECVGQIGTVGKTCWVGQVCHVGKTCGGLGW